MDNKVYAVCTACGEYVYRIPGKRHGDGQQDTDDNPVWLLADYRDMTDDEQTQADANRIQCGCTR